MLNLTAAETTDYRCNTEFCPLCKSPMTIVYGGTIVELPIIGARASKRRAPFAACDSQRCGFAVEIEI